MGINVPVKSVRRENRRFAVEQAYVEHYISEPIRFQSLQISSTKGPVDR